MPDAPSVPFSVEVRVGRLIEARVFSLKSVADVDAYALAIGTQVRRLSSPVLCADHRPVKVYTQPVADRLGELFTRMNTQLDRAALLAARTNATLAFQLDRLIREAAYDKRKLLYAADDAAAFLTPSLSAAELDRLRVFLGEI